MPFDPAPWRLDTAAATAGRVHLNNAGASLMPRPVADAVSDHLRLELQVGGYEAADAARPDIEQAYADLAELVGAKPRNIAMVENATVAFDQALSSFDFEPGDVILTTRNDYVSNQLAYLSLARRRGVRVVRADDAAEGGVDPESVRHLIAVHRPRLVALTWVPTSSGLVQPAAAVGELCRDAGVPYLVDACQAVGQLEVDVGTLHCDFLAATGRKFLRGPRGSGFLFVADRVLDSDAAPLWIDMRGARWTDADAYDLADSARRFENWEFAYALVLGLGAAARYARRVGVAEAGRWAATLAATIRDRLAGRPGVRVLDHGSQLCAIVTVAFDGHDAGQVVERLREQAINTSATRRDWAVLDMDDKRATSAVRVSPHYYNTMRDVDTLLFALDEFPADLAPDVRNDPAAYQDAQARDRRQARPRPE